MAICTSMDMDLQSVPKKINLDYTDQVSYLSGIHRSGWPYVLEQLYKVNNPDGVLCDTNVDRTFHWKGGQTVYEQPWIGFVHHTFDTEFSDYNNVNLLKNERFLASLAHCKGLFVFDFVQRLIWENTLSMMGYTIPVENLVHPTRTPVTPDLFFSMDRFVRNPFKKVVQIGAWLRDNYAIYRLNDGKLGQPGLPLMGHPHTMQKAALRGPRMDHYFKPLNFFRIFTKYELRKDKSQQLFEVEPNVTRIVSVEGRIPVQRRISDIQDEDVGMCGSLMCRDSDYSLNKYVLGSIKLLKDVDDTVLLIPTLTDYEYDALLTQNIVFLKLVDAAAVNTLIECVIRNTPILVNRLPATMDLLGLEYPFFYDDLEQIPEMLTLTRVEEAHLYLRQMDKTKLSGEYFLQSFVDSQIYATL